MHCAYSILAYFIAMTVHPPCDKFRIFWYYYTLCFNDSTYTHLGVYFLQKFFLSISENKENPISGIIPIQRYYSRRYNFALDWYSQYWNSELQFFQSDIIEFFLNETDNYIVDLHNLLCTHRIDSQDSIRSACVPFYSLVSC